MPSFICVIRGQLQIIKESVRQGKEYITQAIKNSFSIGKGIGPLGHFIEIYKKSGIDFE